MSQCFNHNFFSQISDCNEIGGDGKIINNETSMLEIRFL
jgi:hypothetical protein